MTGLGRVEWHPEAQWRGAWQVSQKTKEKKTAESPAAHVHTPCIQVRASLAVESVGFGSSQTVWFES